MSCLPTPFRRKLRGLGYEYAIDTEALAYVSDMLDACRVYYGHKTPCKPFRPARLRYDILPSIPENGVADTLPSGQGDIPVFETTYIRYAITERTEKKKWLSLCPLTRLGKPKGKPTTAYGYARLSYKITLEEMFEELSFRFRENLHYVATKTKFPDYAHAELAVDYHGAKVPDTVTQENWSRRKFLLGTGTLVNGREVELQLVFPVVRTGGEEFRRLESMAEEFRVFVVQGAGRMVRECTSAVKGVESKVRRLTVPRDRFETSRRGGSGWREGVR